MRSTVRQAVESGAAIGAHPGLPDLAGFGRRRMDITPVEAYDMVTYQVGALMAFAIQEGAGLQHVKPHGALYNMAAASRPLADAIASAIKQIDPTLILFGLAGSELIAAGKQQGFERPVKCLRIARTRTTAPSRRGIGRMPSSPIPKLPSRRW